MITPEQANIEEGHLEMGNMIVGYVHNLTTDIYVFSTNREDTMNNHAKAAMELSKRHGKAIKFMNGNVYITVDMTTEPATVICEDEQIKQWIDQEVFGVAEA